jgi:hypothetical protein
VPAGFRGVVAVISCGIRILGNVREQWAIWSYRELGSC